MRNIYDDLDAYQDIFQDELIPPRTSPDKKVNSFGLDLLEFCKSYNMPIANGRLLGDKARGDFTYISQLGCSVID